MDQPTPEDLLDKVCDRKTFVEFVFALASERERAAELEQEDPNHYMVNGALGWSNADIPSFLSACMYNLSELRPDESEPAPSWRLFAETLWDGKIIE